MSNWGSTYLSIYAPDAIATAINRAAGQPIEVLRANGTDGPGGNGTATFLLSALATLPWTMADNVTAYPSIRQGDIAVVYVHDAIANASLRVCSFIIETVELENTSTSAPTVTLSGPDETKELDYLLNFFNIGATYSTTALSARLAGETKITPAAIGAVATTTIQAWHPGENQLKVASNTGFEAGDPIAIELATDNTLHTTIEEVGTEAGSGYKYIQVEATPNVHVDSGARVAVPEFFKGDTIKVTLNDGATHIARLTKNPLFNYVQFDAPLPTTAVSGTTSVAAGAAAVFVTGQTEPVSGNITQIMDFATSFYVGTSTAFRWTLKAGSESSSPTTSHVVNGASTLRLLTDAAEATGNIWRVYRASATAPARTVEWLTTPDASGVTLVMPSQANVAARYASTSYAVMSSIRREGRRNMVTRITPVGGDDSFDLGDALSDGIYTTAYRNGAWIMYHDNASSYMIWRRVTFPDIKLKVDTDAARIDAANRLFEAAEAYLTRQNANGGTDRWYKVKCVWHGEPKVGQAVTLDFAEGQWDTNDITVYISKVSHEVGNIGATAGVRITSLELSEDSPIKREGGVEQVVKAIASGGGGITVRGAYSGSSTGGGAGVTMIAGDNIRLGGGAINLADTVRVRKALYIGGPETNDSRMYLYDRDSGKYREVLIVHSDYGTTTDYPFLRFA